MAKKRVKKRTHVGAQGAPQESGNGPARPGDRSPKSMVIRIGAGEVGPSVSQLVKDVRSMMEPGTATRLKERRSNRLRDYTTMAGPLGVSHLMLFSRSETGNTNMRLAVTPRGPTLHFRVEKYSLCKDVLKSMKRPKSGGADYLTSPLLVMNNFQTTQAQQESSHIPKQLESLTTTIFQSMFPPISPQTTSLKSIKRIMLLDRVKNDGADSDAHPFVLQVRHYSITTTTPKGSLPRPLRRLNAAANLKHSQKKGLPNLGKLDDVADYLLDPTATAGFTSASESEADTDAEVEVLAQDTRKVLTKEERQRIRDAQRSRVAENGEEAGKPRDRPAAPERVEKKAIKLQELGPRMTLRLTKVEEGICGGKVMWHEYIQKSKAEEKEMEAVWKKRNAEKEERRRIQKENVERKKKEKKAAGGADDEQEDEDEDMEDFDPDDDEWDSEGLEGNDGEEDGEEEDEG